MKRLNYKQIDEIFARLSLLDPAPKTELEFTNHYTLLVAIVLSAQATDISVNKATKQLFQDVTTPLQMLALGETALKTYIKSIGLFNTKAKHIIALSKILAEQYYPQFPTNFEQLIKLPGVGRKTAKVFLNCAVGEPVIAVDTHVYRVSNRLSLTIAKNALESELQLEKVVPAQWKKHAHHWLILHGRYICKARKPRCSKCILKDLCPYEQRPY